MSVQRIVVLATSSNGALRSGGKRLRHRVAVRADGPVADKSECSASRCVRVSVAGQREKGPPSGVGGAKVEPVEPQGAMRELWGRSIQASGSQISFLFMALYLQLYTACGETVFCVYAYWW